MRIFCLLLFTLPVLAQSPATVTRVGGSEQGHIVFQERCIACHGNNGVPQAPSAAALRGMSVQRIYNALTTGAMQAHTGDLSAGDIKAVAESVSGQLLDTGPLAAAENMPNQCSQASGFQPGSPAWNGWGLDFHNSRHQSAADAVINSTQVKGLQLRWAFGFAGGESAYGQPSVTGGRVFVGADNGYVYAMDAGTGCVFWSYKAQAGVRTSVIIDSYDGMHAAIFGDTMANLYALNAEDGSLLWRRKVDNHIAARITASPVIHDSVIYVPVAAWEEGAARSEYYSCCTFRGSIAAYAVNDGYLLWKTYTIQAPPKRTRKNRLGVQLFAPAGAAVWNTPVVDIKNNTLVFGTGNAYTVPAANSTDAVMALDLDTGKVIWQRQIVANDAFLVGCAAVDSENCPAELGQDRDIPSSLMLVEQGGKRSLIVSTRPNEVLALYPVDGSTRWHSQVPGGGLQWGGTHDMQAAYFGLSSGGVVALALADGRQLWFTPFPGENNGAVSSSIDGVVFTGGIAGTLRALDSQTGSLLWEFDTTHEFDTVNKVPARGGSMTNTGAVIAGGQLYVTAGYSIIFGKPGNVLLVFGPDNGPGL